MSRPTLATSRPAPTRMPYARLCIADGTLEAIKWLALILMTLDHINTYLLDHMQVALYSLGRIAMPLFVFVLAYNLARPEAAANGAMQRTALRLAFYGALASVPFIALGHVSGGWWPLNILVTLLVATLVIGLLERDGQAAKLAALVVFIVGGALVEYLWFAVGLALVCWRYCQQTTLVRLGGVVGAVAALCLINRNLWALGAVPLMLAAPYITLRIPRRPLLFYVYYPVHLGLLFVLTALLR
jgi:hypothetical protein